MTGLAARLLCATTHHTRIPTHVHSGRRAIARVENALGAIPTHATGGRGFGFCAIRAAQRERERPLRIALKEALATVGIVTCHRTTRVEDGLTARTPVSHRRRVLGGILAAQRELAFRVGVAHIPLGFAAGLRRTGNGRSRRRSCGGRGRRYHNHNHA